jgi:S-DNA-T family DNA segregation ATPase FtsK/SpoIIIE
MFGQKLPIFPKAIRDATLKLIARAVAAALLVFACYAAWFVFSRPVYLQTWTNFSSAGESAPWIMSIVDLCEFAIGAAPLLFVLVFLFRTALLMAAGRRRLHTERTAMQVFIAAASLSAALAFLIPNGVGGGVFGIFLAQDLGVMAGPQAGIIFGTVFLASFVFLAFSAFGITANGILRFFYRVGSAIAWVFAKLPIRRRAPDFVVDGAAGPEVKKKAAVRKNALKKVVKKKKPAAESKAGEIEYRLPPPELLEKSNFASNTVTREHREIAANMEVNFAKYGISGKVMEIHPGPIVTRYDFEPDDGQRINKIMETATDMRRAMATEQIRIALVPRTRYIGVEMVNPNRQFVYYQGLVSAPEFTESKMGIPLALGVEISGRPFYADLAKMPHLLIAGRTGSGKSVFVQSIITSIVYHSRPDEVKLVIVDPKGVDFNKWRDIPHLITPIVTDAAAAVNVLKWSVREMEDRYRELQSAEAQNIADYNALVDKMIAKGRMFKKKVPVGTDGDGNVEYEMQESEPQRMPYIVMIMDEIADLMQQARKEVEACVQRITQKARAAGIHLVAATQRPDATVITGVIKSNLPTRISFQARSYIDSMTTLGERGAEMLLAQGDMLYSESGKQPIRIHGAFIQDREIDKVARFLRAEGMPEYVDGITDMAADVDSAALGLPPGKDEKDGDLYAQAVEIVRRDKRPTTSYIQRRLGIGYNKAAVLIEKMEAAGIITKMPSGKYEVA